MNRNNIINLSNYRKEKEKKYPQNKLNICGSYFDPSDPPQYIQKFKVGGYYIYPELGVMIHCMLITDNSHTHNNELMYIMEDQFGNLLSIPISDPDSMMGWRSLDKEVFIETAKEIAQKKLSEPEFEPEPPRVS